MKSKFLTVMMTALSVLTPALTLMSPSLAHANESIVCKLNENPLYGIAIVPTGSNTLPSPGPGHLPSNNAQYPVLVTFFGPNTSNSVHAILTAQSFSTRLGPETSYSIELNKNEKINLFKHLKAYTGDEPYKLFFNGEYSIPAKTYALTCK